MDVSTSASPAPSSTPQSTSTPSASSGNNAGNGGGQSTGRPSSSPSPTSSGHASSASSTGVSSPIGSHDPNERIEVLFNGKALKLTRQELIDRASMSHAAQEKFDEAKKIQREHDARKERYKENRFQAYLDASQDLTPDQQRAEIEAYYASKYIDPETLSADQRRVKELEEENTRYKSERERSEKDQKEAEEQRLTGLQREQLQTQIMEAIDQSGLPKLPSIVKQLAAIMRQNVLNGWEAPMDMVIRQLKNDRQAERRNEIKESTAEQIIDLYGDEIVNKIRSYDLKRLREKRGMPVSDSRSSPDPLNKPKEKVYMSDVTRRIRDMTGRGL